MHISNLMFCKQACAACKPSHAHALCPCTRTGAHAHKENTHAKQQNERACSLQTVKREHTFPTHAHMQARAQAKTRIRISKTSALSPRTIKCACTLPVYTQASTRTGTTLMRTGITSVRSLRTDKRACALPTHTRTQARAQAK
jgi:hypothetical protein